MDELLVITDAAQPSLAERDDQVAAPVKRLTEFKRVLNQNSSNSSKPPLSGQPGTKKVKGTSWGERRRGQHGNNADTGA